EPVTLRDLPATVMHLLGRGTDAPFPGRSLTRFWKRLDGDAPPAFEPLIMETDKPTLLVNLGREPAAKGPMQAVVAGGMHYIRTGDGSEELFSLQHDPDEKMNVGAAPDAQEALEGFRRFIGRTLRPRVERGQQTAGIMDTQIRRE